MPEILEAQRENLGKVKLEPEACGLLTRILSHATEQNVAVTFYLSPVHPAQFSLLHQDRAWERFDGWRNDMAYCATLNRVSFYDFSEARFGDEDALFASGTTAHWQDPTHFTPKVGAWLLEQMGVQ